MKIQNVYFVAEDVAATADFYQALGLGLKFRDGERWAQFGAGGTNFSISSREEAPEEAAQTSGAVVVFEVDDIEAACAAVEAGGGTLGGRRDMGDHGKTVTFTDPAGNVCQLFQRAG